MFVRAMRAYLVCSGRQARREIGLSRAGGLLKMQVGLLESPATGRVCTESEAPGSRDLMIDKRQTKSTYRDWVGKLLWYAVLPLLAVEAFAFFVYRSEPVVDVLTRNVFCILFLILGYWYFRLKERFSRLWVGIISLAAGLGSNWYEVSKWSKSTDERYDRLVFVVAGTAVIAHGFKEISEGLKKSGSNE